MRSLVVRSSDLRAGPDNPCGRMDVAYAHLITLLRSAARRDPDEIMVAFVRVVGSSLKQTRARYAALARTFAPEPLAATVLGALRLKEPSEEVRVGALHFARAMIASAIEEDRQLIAERQEGLAEMERRLRDAGPV